MVGLLKKTGGEIGEIDFLCKSLIRDGMVEEAVLTAFRDQFKLLDKDGSGVLDRAVTAR